MEVKTERRKSRCQEFHRWGNGMNVPRQVSRCQQHKTGDLEHHSPFSWESLDLYQQATHTWIFSGRTLGNQTEM